MANTVTVKEGDTHDLTLTVGGSSTVDLTGASAELHVRDESGTVQSFAVTLGESTAVWTLDGTLTAGWYELELEITQSDDTVVTAPSSGFVRLHVIADLA